MSSLTPARQRTSSVLGAARRATGWPLALICAAQFVLQLDFSIVNVALPSIQAELHVTAASLQWIITGYALTYGSLLLTGGRIGDLAGHRRMLLAGLLLFGLTSLAAGLATSFVVLIVARFAQGASAALVAPSALAVLTGMYHEGPARTRALSIFQAATAGGATAGIVLGGLLTSYIGWRAIFLVNPPVIAVLVGGAAPAASARRRPGPHPPRRGGRRRLSRCRSPASSTGSARARTTASPRRRPSPPSRSPCCSAACSYAPSAGPPRPFCRSPSSPTPPAGPRWPRCC